MESINAKAVNTQNEIEFFSLNKHVHVQRDAVLSSCYLGGSGLEVKDCRAGDKATCFPSANTTAPYIILIVLVCIVDYV